MPIHKLLLEKHQSWRTWVEPWYLAYALLGASSAGLLPMLMPLVVNQKGSATAIGLVMAALNVSGLFAPLWGWFADRYRLHRWILIVGLAINGIGIALFALVNTTVLWALTAMALNFGAIAAGTVANLFVVERHPRAEWDERLGWLQTAYGGGQVLGLLLAAVVSQTDLQLGLGIACVCCLLGLMIAWMFVQTPPPAPRPSVALLHPTRHTDGMFSSPQQLFHHLNLNIVRNVRTIVGTPFSLWLGAWLLAASGSGAFFALYPMVMQQVFGISASFSASGFAISAAIGLFLYAPAGAWTHRLGSRRLFQRSIMVRITAYALLWFIGAFVSVGWLALPLFTAIVVAWSFISVSATALTAQLSPVAEGEGIGMFNAISALANIIGASLGGWVAAQFGYQSVALVAAVGITLGLACTFVMPRDAAPVQ